MPPGDSTFSVPTPTLLCGAPFVVTARPLTLFTVQTESISIKKRENLEAPVLNIFMTGDWGGPRESISDDGSKPAQDKYGLSISYSMNQLAEI